MHAARAPDPRSRRTQEALQSALTVLALRRRYHEIRIDDILQASGVGRSTFYEHYRSKDALLRASMRDAISLLADLPVGTADAAQAEALLAHFWSQRALARTLLQGTALRVVRDALRAEIETRLPRQGRGQRFPHRLAAVAIADGLLSPCVAWLSGEAQCSPAELAGALTRASRALAEALLAVHDE